MDVIDDAAMGAWTAWQLDKLALHGASKAYKLAQELAAWARVQPNHYPKSYGAQRGGTAGEVDGAYSEFYCDVTYTDAYDSLGSGTLGLDAGADTAITE